MVNKAILLSTLEFILPKFYFKNACMFEKSCKYFQNRRNKGNQTTAEWRDTLSIFKSSLQKKLFPCLYNGDKAEVMVKKAAFAVTTCIVLPSWNMGIYIHTYLSLSWHYICKHVAVPLGREKKKSKRVIFPTQKGPKLHNSITFITILIRSFTA